MKKLFWMMLAALPMQAMANEDDPIAYKCYYCTPAEMEDVALAQGVGRHYVYDASNLNISGFDITTIDGHLVVTPFVAENWVQSQFKGMMALYSSFDGTMNAIITDPPLLAPGSDHGRNSQLMWGHHLSMLHPAHERSWEVVNRYLKTVPSLEFINIPEAEGRLLRLAYMETGMGPLTATLYFYDSDLGSAVFGFEHSTRRWHFLEAKDRKEPVQLTRDDFAPQQGNTYFDYGKTFYKELAEAFIERAGFAGVPVHGELTSFGPWDFRCERKAEDIQCYVM